MLSFKDTILIKIFVTVNVFLPALRLPKNPQQELEQTNTDPFLRKLQTAGLIERTQVSGRPRSCQAFNSNMINLAQS